MKGLTPRLSIRCGILALLSAISSASPVSALDDNKCTVANSAIHSASAIRGLKIKRHVPCVLQEKAAVRKYLLETLSERVPKKKLTAEAVSYRLLGFIPEDFDYESGIVSLYTDQIGGYYDTKKDRYVMAAWLPEFMQISIAVHELTHALQDQHFDLEKFSDDESLTSDQQLARAALVEGDAMCVMSDFGRSLTNDEPLEEAQSVAPMMAQSILGMIFTPTAAGTPPTLQMMMVFPYISGVNYAHRHLRQGGYAKLDALFTSPPQSTSEILHPELQGFVPEKVKPTDCALGQKELGTDTLGEFMISTLVGSFSSVSVGALAAQGWAGDGLRVCQNDEVEQVFWTTRWQTEQDAREFRSRMSEIFTRRFGAADADKWTSSRFSAAIRISETKDVVIDIQRRVRA